MKLNKKLSPDDQLMEMINMMSDSLYSPADSSFDRCVEKVKKLVKNGADVNLTNSRRLNVGHLIAYKFAYIDSKNSKNATRIRKYGFALAELIYAGLNFEARDFNNASVKYYIKNADYSDHRAGLVCLMNNKANDRPKEKDAN